MIDITKLTYPMTLKTLEYEAPEVYQELISMDAELRTVLLTWLNGEATSPPKRNNADREFDKEDAKQSELKLKHFVEFESAPVGNSKFVVHLMTEQQRHDFFNNREAMKARVKKKVKGEQVKRAKTDLKRVYKILGQATKAELMKLEAVNEPLYKEKAE